MAIENASIGTRIRQSREAAGIGRGRLANHLKVDLSTVSRIESGAVMVSAARLGQIADFLGVPVSTFYGATRTPRRRRKSA